MKNRNSEGKISRERRRRICLGIATVFNVSSYHSEVDFNFKSLSFINNETQLGLICYPLSS